MIRSILRIGFITLVGAAVLSAAAVLAGRVLRADAPEITFMRGQNDVYALDVERRFVHPLAHSVLPMVSPRWSPDGRSLTYTVVDGSGSTSIVRVDPDGATRVLLRDAISIWSTAWSPDGNELAFIANGRLYRMSADGQNVHPLDMPIHSQGYSLSWSPDGENLAFIGGGADAQPYVYLLNLAAGADVQRPVTQRPANPRARPSWSANGQQLAFVSGTSLYVANVDGSGEQYIANANIARSSSWSPDGRLAFISELRLHVTAPDGGVQPLATGLPIDRSPAWSPDGAWLAFVSGGDLYRVKPDGGELQLLTPDIYSLAITDFAWRQ